MFHKSSFCDRYGPWAVVTGASSGIGRAIVAVLAEKSLNLVLVARNRVALERVAEDVESRFSVKTLIVDVDLSHSDGTQAILSATEQLDVGLLVVSAGFGTSGPFLDASIEEETAMLDVNCRALMLQTHAFANRFAKRGGGGVILLSSIVAFQGAPFASHYAATKSYVQALADGLSLELRSHGIDVLASAPGPTSTGFAERARMKMGSAMSADTVAQQTVAALGRRSTVLPGGLSKLLGYSLAALPRWIRTRIMGSVMTGMTK
ncbi:MAG: SDR family NAD(P)-dependent oxidoreductase [Planctomyces sp.]